MYSNQRNFKPTEMLQPPKKWGVDVIESQDELHNVSQIFSYW